jgi:hypothetical protein
MEERERVETEFSKAHPKTAHLKAKIDRARQQHLARRS